MDKSTFMYAIFDEFVLIYEGLDEGGGGLVFTIH